jgi:hypothetical protein
MKGLKQFFNLTLLIYLLFIATSSDAQLRIGPKVGLNISHKTNINARWLTGVNAGFLADYNLVGGLFFQSGLSFSQRGFKRDLIFCSSDGSNYPVVMKYRINSLEVPLNVGYRFYNGNVKLLVFGGFYTCYDLNLKETFTHEEKEFDYISNEDLGGFKNRLEWGGSIGAGLEYRNFQITTQYNREFFKIDNYNSKNQLFCFSLAYFFSFK